MSQTFMEYKTFRARVVDHPIDHAHKYTLILLEQCDVDDQYEPCKHLSDDEALAAFEAAADKIGIERERGQ